MAFENDWLNVLFIAGITALATGLGIIPFLFSKNIKKTYTGYANAVASGLMLAASFRLINEGITYSLEKSLIGFAAGLLIIHFTNRYLEGKEELKVGQLSGANALKVILIVGVMTIHSFAEGIGVGVSFSGGKDFGLFIATAITVHNIPEGLAISVVLVPKGVKLWKTCLWAIFSSLPQPLLAVPAFLFVETFENYLPVGLGLAGGAMIWMVAAELLPDALEDADKNKVGLVMAFSVLLMMLFQTLIAV